MAETTTKRRRPAANPPRNQVQVAPIPMQPAGTAGGGAGEKLTDRIKEHPFVSGSVLAVTVAGIYLLYQHFHNQSSTTTTAANGSSGGGLALNTGSRGHYAGSASGDGGSGSGGGGSGNGGTVPAPTVDVSGLAGLLAGIQSEIGLLGQDLAGLQPASPSTGGSGGGGGGGPRVLPYSVLPNQPVNSLPSNAATVNVPVGGATYSVPYTGAKPSPALVSELGTTIAANAGMATNGITSQDIAAAKASVAAGAGSQAPSGSSYTPAAPKASASLPAKPTTAPKATSSSTASSQAALANQIAKKVAAQPAPKPASTAPKTITTTAGKTEAVNTAGKTSIRPG